LKEGSYHILDIDEKAIHGQKSLVWQTWQRESEDVVDDQHYNVDSISSRHQQQAPVEMQMENS